MRTLLYLATALCVMGLAFWAYHVNYATQDRQGELRALKNEIASLQEGLSVLRAEWAYQNRPDRLRELVNMNFTDLQLLPLAPEQFGSVGQVAYPNPDAPTAGMGATLSGMKPIDVVNAPDALLEEGQ